LSTKCRNKFVNCNLFNPPLLGGKESRRGVAPASLSGVAPLKPCFQDFSLSKRGSRGIAPCGADGAKPRHTHIPPKAGG